jgi:site-specific recombinase XerD
LGKGAKERKLLLGQQGYHYLSGYRDHWYDKLEHDSEPLNLIDAGSPLTHQTPRQLFRRLKVDSGITNRQAGFGAYLSALGCDSFPAQRR